MRFKWLFAFLLSAALAGLASAQTPAPAGLVALVRGFYVPYLGGDGGPEPPDSLTVIAAHATPVLRVLIARDQACQRRTQGVCNVDFDPIINGQDWDLNGKLPMISVKQQTADEVIIGSQFMSDGSPTEVDYTFEKIKGAWLVADLSTQDQDDGPWRLTQMLLQPEQ